MQDMRRPSSSTHWPLRTATVDYRHSETVRAGSFSLRAAALPPLLALPPLHAGAGAVPPLQHRRTVALPPFVVLRGAERPLPAAQPLQHMRVECQQLLPVACTQRMRTPFSLGCRSLIAHESYATFAARNRPRPVACSPQCSRALLQHFSCRLVPPLQRHEAARLPISAAQRVEQPGTSPRGA